MEAYHRAEEQHALDSGAGQAMGVIANTGDYATILEQLIASDTLPTGGVQQLQYGALQLESVVVAIIRDGQLVNQAIVGDQIGIVLRENAVLMLKRAGKFLTRGCHSCELVNGC
jgi:hypothetical protein